MFKFRSLEPELLDNFDLQGKELEKNLDEIELVNTYLGGYSVVDNAIKKLNLSSKKQYTISDIGCGSGDGIRHLNKKFKEKKIKVDLIGIDANPNCINYAKSLDPNASNVNYLTANVFEKEFENIKQDIAICSLVLHHFTDQQIVFLLNTLLKTTRKAIIINDLHRNPIAYYSIKYLTKLLGGSKLVQNDAPLSVLKAFKKTELENLISQTSASKVLINWKWAFRYQVIIYP